MTQFTLSASKLFDVHQAVETATKSVQEDIAWEQHEQRFTDIDAIDLAFIDEAADDPFYFDQQYEADWYAEQYADYDE